MGWSSDWLYQLLLKRARRTFAEALDWAVNRREPAPQLLVATEHAGWNQMEGNCRPGGEPVRVWTSADDFATAHRTLPEPEPPGEGYRWVHPVTCFAWHILPNRKQVLICRWIGPLYANGGWWDVVGQGRRGKLVRADRMCWVS